MTHTTGTQSLHEQLKALPYTDPDNVDDYSTGAGEIDRDDSTYDLQPKKKTMKKITITLNQEQMDRIEHCITTIEHCETLVDAYTEKRDAENTLENKQKLLESIARLDEARSNTSTFFINVYQYAKNTHLAEQEINNQQAQLLTLFDQMTAECRTIIEAKNKDYSGGQDTPFANFMASELIGVPPELGLLMRCMDKFKRIEAFVRNGQLAVKSEPVGDAIRDTINYMVLLQGLINHQQAQKE